ncbi:MAG: hypothetical protein ACREEM_20390 [Blastocatellia bacterium]
MENATNFELSNEQAAQLNDLIEMCVKELRETNEYMTRRQDEIDQLQAETRVIIARMQQRAKEEWNVEANYGPFSASLAFD